MSLGIQLLVSVVIAAIAATLTTILKSGEPFDPVILAGFCLATVVTTLIVRGRDAGPVAAAAAEPARARTRPPAAASPVASAAGREHGHVKWFNVSKGFGFIVRDDGEEIFVHFRSIRGEGRRALRDGQRVSFVVAQSDKGPQAEDVAAEN